MSRKKTKYRQYFVKKISTKKYPPSTIDNLLTFNVKEKSKSILTHTKIHPYGSQSCEYTIRKPSHSQRHSRNKTQLNLKNRIRKNNQTDILAKPILSVPAGLF